MQREQQRGTEQLQERAGFGSFYQMRMLQNYSLQLESSRKAVIPRILQRWSSIRVQLTDACTAACQRRVG